MINSITAFHGFDILLCKNAAREGSNTREKQRVCIFILSAILRINLTENKKQKEACF